MNYDDFEKKMIDKVCQVISSGLKGASFISEMYWAFTKENRKYTDDLRSRNTALINTFEDIAKMYGLEYKEGITLDQIEKGCMDLKNKIASLASSDKPKQRYLCYSWADDCGHSYCEVITKKDFKDIENILNDYSNNGYEHLYYKDSTLLIGMSARLNKSIEDLTGVCVDHLICSIEEFFRDIISDDSVTLLEYSEYLKSLIYTGRHSGCATTWVNL